jgi:hypothetical protein
MNTDPAGRMLTVIKIVTNKEPPPGFTFVPFGNPKLTTACKELSRELGAMMFIVSVRSSSTFSEGLLICVRIPRKPSRRFQITFIV